jgi:hypothetical protein
MIPRFRFPGKMPGGRVETTAMVFFAGKNPAIASMHPDMAK